MFEIPVECLSCVFGCNQSVLSRSLRPHSLLKKKKSSCMAYHFVRVRVFKNERRTACLITRLNPSDVRTKSSLSSDNRTLFTGYILHYLD